MAMALRLLPLPSAPLLGHRLPAVEWRPQPAQPGPCQGRCGWHTVMFRPLLTQSKPIANARRPRKPCSGFHRYPNSVFRISRSDSVASSARRYPHETTGFLPQKAEWWKPKCPSTPSPITAASGLPIQSCAQSRSAGGRVSPPLNVGQMVWAFHL